MHVRALLWTTRNISRRHKYSNLENSHMLVQCDIMNNTQVRAWPHQVVLGRFCVHNFPALQLPAGFCDGPVMEPWPCWGGRTRWIWSGVHRTFIHISHPQPRLAGVWPPTASPLPRAVALCPRRLRRVLSSHAPTTVPSVMEETTITAIDIELRQLQFR